MDKKNIKKGAKTMAITIKPTNRAFVLDPEKADAFLMQKNNSAKKTMDRFFAHQPKKGVRTPFKGKDV